ncbi:MAG: ferric iron uptake transcriptional regulator [Candidatus Contendobacter sp.]|nr:ferric iron uptake transcriptional regulator [Candidatus Contendobacter sp.]MDG4558332.1 ferric iron uptake transcriptional regulator [Candidatus Contendobacter sp.]
MGSKELKQAGLKVTLPRMKILDMLQHQDGMHLTAEEIFRALEESGEEVGLATVYRVLTQFESAGLVKRHHFEGGHSVFELNQGEHHDHILCLECGRIEEFCDEDIEQRQHVIAQRLGFELAEHCLILYGHCNRADCPHRSPEEGEKRDGAMARGED